MAQRLQIGDQAPDFEFQIPWSPGQSFYGATGKNPAVLVFLRYLGCPVCQMEMALLKREIALFTQKGAQVYVFLQSTPESVARSSNQEDWPFTIVCDPYGLIFQKYNVAPGGVLKYLHPAGAIAAIKSILKGFRHGKFEGKETQLPAAFIVDAMKIVAFSYYGSHVGDVPAPETLSALLNKELQ